MPEVVVDKENSGLGFVRLLIDGVGLYIETATGKDGSEYISYIEDDEDVWYTRDTWEDMGEV